MKNVKRPLALKKAGSPMEAARAAAKSRGRAWPWAAAFVVALFVVLEVYEPALRGPFLFDDRYLPFLVPAAADLPLFEWVKGLRPALMFTFWLNRQLHGADPYPYHLWNVLLHLLNAALVVLIVRRVLAMSEERGWRADTLSVFAGGVFLLHPLATESVAYVASRSETLSVLFVHSAIAAFLYRRSRAITVFEAIGVLALYALACLSKEHAAVVPAVLLLADCYWNPGFSFAGIKRNWRLYAPLAAVAAGGLAMTARVLSTADTAGFTMRDLPWTHYFFTQCRAIWVYFRLFLFPYGLNLDHDFAYSRSLLDRGALFGLIGLAALATVAWLYRKSHPLASFGFLAALALLAPTSSFVPIRDPLAERRVYLASLGLLLVMVEFLRRWNARRPVYITVFAVVLLILAGLTRQRNQAWSSAIALWESTVAASPNKARPHFQLAFAYYDVGRCDRALISYARAAELQKPDHRLLVDWALAYDCAGQTPAAVEKLNQAAALEKTAHVYATLGMMHAKLGRREEALAALELAMRLDASFEMTYAYRGNVLATSGDLDKAEAEYRRALAINPANEVARNGLRMLETRRARQ